MKILIVSATGFELAQLLEHIEKNGTKKSFFEYQYEGHQIFPLVTGVGSLNTSFGLSRYPDIKNIDLALNIGICGAYDKTLHLGDVVEICKDRFGDLGVEEADNSFTDVYQLELENPNRFPFQDGWLSNTDPKYGSRRQKVNAVTVNKVSGTAQTIENISNLYNPQAESMEGAGFIYACKAMDIDCLQLRAISNYVEPRNKENWKLNEALDSLSKVTIDYLSELPKEINRKSGLM